MSATQLTGSGPDATPETPFPESNGSSAGGDSEIQRKEGPFRSLVGATSAIVWHTPGSGEFETEQPGWTAFTG